MTSNTLVAVPRCISVPGLILLLFYARAMGQGPFTPPPQLSIIVSPNIISAAQQPSVECLLANPSPSDISGQLTISFQQNADIPSDDPNILFSTGSRKVNFKIPAGTTAGIFADANRVAQMSTGTIAGTITLTASLMAANGADITPQPPPTTRLVLNRVQPVTRSVTIEDRTETSFSVVANGYSTPRSVTNAHVTFIATEGANHASFDYSVKEIFDNWYRSAIASAFGSQFSLRMPFTYQGDLGGIGSVSVQISNSGNLNSADPTFVQPEGYRGLSKDPIAGRQVKTNGSLAAMISSPPPEALVRGDIPIFGVAYGDNFKEYQVLIGAGSAPTEWTILNRSSVPESLDLRPDTVDTSADVTVHGNLATWDTGLKTYVYLPSHPKNHPVDLKGIYTVRLLVMAKNGGTVEDQVTVEVGDVIPNAWGATITSDDGKASLHVPEQAITDAFRIVSIRKLDESPVPVQTGLQRFGPIYKFREVDEPFAKAATLEMPFPAVDELDEQKWRIYEYDEHKKSWAPLETKLLDVKDKGRALVRKLSAFYAVMSDAAIPKLIDRPAAPPRVPTANVTRPVGPGLLLRQTFEDGVGTWSDRDGFAGGLVSLDNLATLDRTNCLRISNPNDGGNFAVTILSQPFDVSEYPLVRFDYKIPEGVKTNFFARVADHWYEVRFTDDINDLRYKRVNIANVGEITGVKADNEWHTAEFNLYDMLRSKTNHRIVQELIMADWDVRGYMKLVFGHNPKGASYWIDNFNITSDGKGHLAFPDPSIVIDNFNQKKSTNSLGQTFGIFFNPGVGSATAAFVPDASPYRGYSMEFNYDVKKPGAYAGFLTLIRGLDLRAFQLLTLRVAGLDSGQEMFVGLKDASDHESKVLARRYLTSEPNQQWTTIAIPLSAFVDIVDWSRLDNLSLSFENISGTVGTIRIDDIVFSRILSHVSVNDFSSANDRNLLGRQQRTFTSGAAAISGAYVNALDGHAYRLSFGGSIGAPNDSDSGLSHAGWATDLGAIDCSACGMVTFAIRGAEGDEKPHIYLDDGNQRWGIDLSPYGKLTQNWQKISIPLAEFAAYSVDLSHLMEFQVVFEWEKMSGTVFIDDIEFGSASLAESKQ